jgi:dienelactone hydrolase
VTPVFNTYYSDVTVPKLLRMKKLLVWLWLVWLLNIQVNAAPAERLYFLSNGQVRQACVYIPEGKGPFPVVMFNERSVNPLREEGSVDPFPQLGRFYNSHGYALFITGRHAPHNVPAGEMKRTSAEKEKLLMGYHAEEAETIFAALSTLKAQSYVDADRVYVTGYSAGAIATLLFAEKEANVRGFVVFSPGAQVWSQQATLRSTLEHAVQNATAPVLLIQHENDYGLLPSKVLGKILKEKGSPNRSKIFPPWGRDSDHATNFPIVCTDIWGPDVIAFLRELEK